MPLGEETYDGARSTENFIRTMVVGHLRGSRKWVSLSTGRRRVEGPSNNPFRISGINRCTMINQDERRPEAMHRATSELFLSPSNILWVNAHLQQSGRIEKNESAKKVPKGH